MQITERISGWLRNLILLLVDFLLIYLSYTLGMYLRYGIFSLNEPEFFQNGLFFSLIILILLVANGVYRISWSYSTSRDLLIILRGTVIGYLAGFLFGRFMLLFGINIFTVPFTVATMCFVGATFFIVFSRILWLSLLFYRSKRGEPSSRKILIIGAGDAGTSIADEIIRNPPFGKVIGFLDDSPRKQKKKIHGIPVLGHTEKTMEIIKNYNVELVIIAMPSVESKEIRRIMKYIDRDKVRVQILPALIELIDMKASLGYLRDINITDILGRESVQIDKRKIKEYIENEIVLVTGAGGSIGSELCRQIVMLNPKKIILLGKGENSIFSISRELQDKYPSLRVSQVIGDIQDKKRMEYIFSIFKPTIVFHAAAHKHVPLMEKNPIEALRVNTLGTYNVAHNAVKHKCKAFIMISTDKAVNPTSVMGVSKRLAEELLRSLARNENTSNTRIGMVRFGNVLGSRGSVIPLFKKQIENGGPLTVTDPRMKRYFMTIPEAVSLVLQAGSYASNGEVFVLDMGKPVKIADLAKDMITLSGYVPDQEIKIKYTGVRPGEKLFEELKLDSENFEDTDHPKILKFINDNTLNKEDTEELLRKIEKIVKEQNPALINEIIKTYLPDAVSKIVKTYPELD
ncbi:MAG: nucleoside-diphosphate sugar epimerase/dehydratase [Thermotogota bacterium]|nr:nucleoside-diphosphate sugar epimerase/dehydratase [Thermotogota bacterium]